MPLLYVTFCISLVRDILFLSGKSRGILKPISLANGKAIALTSSGNQINQSNLIADPVKLPSARKCFS